MASVCIWAFVNVLVLMGAMPGAVSTAALFAECGCPAVPNPTRETRLAEIREAFRASDVVFAGEVVARDETTVTLKPGRVWKGADTAQVRMRTGVRISADIIQISSCVEGFGDGTWLVFAGAVEPGLFVSGNCGPGGRLPYRLDTLELLDAVCRDEKTCRAPLSQSSLDLPSVAKSPTSFTGHSTCWTGRIAGSATTVDVRGNTLLHLTHWVVVREPGLPLAFAVEESSARRTPAAEDASKAGGDPGERRVCGVIAGSRETTVTIYIQPRTVQAPVLLGAIIDLVTK